MSGNPDASGSAHTMATWMAYLLLAEPRPALWWKRGRGVSTGNTCRWLIHVVIFRMIPCNSATPSYTDFPLLAGFAGCRTPPLPGEHHSEKNVVADSPLLTPILAPCSGLMHLHTFYQELYHPCGDFSTVLYHQINAWSVSISLINLACSFSACKVTKC